MAVNLSFSPIFNLNWKKPSRKNIALGGRSKSWKQVPGNVDDEYFQAQMYVFFLRLKLNFWISCLDM